MQASVLTPSTLPPYNQARAFEAANQNLIFHVDATSQFWCFTRAHLVFAAVVPDGIKFRFPLYEVKVTVNNPDAVLNRVLSGTISHISDMPNEGPTSHFIRATAITIESLEQASY